MFAHSGRPEPLAPPWLSRIADTGIVVEFLHSENLLGCEHLSLEQRRPPVKLDTVSTPGARFSRKLGYKKEESTSATPPLPRLSSWTTEVNVLVARYSGNVAMGRNRSRAFLFEMVVMDFNKRGAQVDSTSTRANRLAVRFPLPLDSGAC